VVYAAVYAARAGKPRPLGLLPELLTKMCHGILRYI
jgi:hypothetical protein